MNFWSTCWRTRGHNNIDDVRGLGGGGGYLSVGVSDGFAGIEDEGQSEVGDAGGEVGAQQDVLGLEVAVGHGRLGAVALAGGHLLVQVRQAARHALADAAQLRPRHRVALPQQQQQQQQHQQPFP